MKYEGRWWQKMINTSNDQHPPLSSPSPPPEPLFRSFFSATTGNKIESRPGPGYCPVSTPPFCRSANCFLAMSLSIEDTTSSWRTDGRVGVDPNQEWGLSLASPSSSYRLPLSLLLFTSTACSNSLHSVRGHFLVIALPPRPYHIRLTKGIYVALCWVQLMVRLLILPLGIIIAREMAQQNVMNDVRPAILVLYCLLLSGYQIDGSMWNGGSEWNGYGRAIKQAVPLLIHQLGGQNPISSSVQFLTIIIKMEWNRVVRSKERKIYCNSITLLNQLISFSVQIT